MITMRAFFLTSICLNLALFLGCPGEAILQDDDDTGGADDDDSGVGDDDDATPGDDDDATPGDDDDTTAGDDDDTGGSTDPDDDTCDEGATSSTSITFYVQSTFLQPIEGLDWSIYDHDAFSGTVDQTVIESGTTGPDGQISVSLDCADGWMMLHTAHADFVTQRTFFRVLATPVWPIILVEETLAATTVGLLIDSDDEGVLALYKATSLGGPDFQGIDTFAIDSGSNLNPAGATNDLGMWIYAGALGIEVANVWHVNADVPDHGAVALLEYADDSENHTTAVHAPIWSWDSGNTNHELTAVYVID
jgi:hypothetical protein